MLNSAIYFVYSVFRYFIITFFPFIMFSPFFGALSLRPLRS